jgi:hypothetical protein
MPILKKGVTVAAAALVVLAAWLLQACGNGVLDPTASPLPVSVETPDPAPDLTQPSMPDPSEPPAPPTPDLTPTPQYTMPPLEEIGPDTFYIYVEKGSHTMTIYSEDENGEYTNVVHTFLTATGKTAAKTPVGIWELGTRERWHTFSMLAGGHEYTQYTTSFKVGYEYSPNTGKLYIHSAEYYEKDPSRLDTGMYNQIGRNATAGCLRTTAYAAWWVYTYCPPGTVLEIVNGDPKGTSAEPIPDPVRGDGRNEWYDPTDPEYPGFVEPPIG